MDLNYESIRDIEFSQDYAFNYNSEEASNDDEDEIIDKPFSMRGIYWMLLSMVCSGLGNGLESISFLSWVFPFTFIVAFELTVLSFSLGATLFMLLIAQSAALTFAFNGILGYPVVTPATVGLTFVLALLIWGVFIMLSIVPHYYFKKRYPNHLFLPFVFPAAFVTVSNVIFGRNLSTYFSLANSVLDYAPLRQVSSIFGLSGINFILTFMGNLCALLYIDHARFRTMRTFRYAVLFCVFLFTYTGYILIEGRFYQQNIYTFLPETVPVSCIFGQQGLITEPEYEQVWAATAERALARDRFILWSEEALAAFSVEEETAILDKASQIALSSNGSSYIGVTYLLDLSEDDNGPITNNFALVTPSGSVAWMYEKAYPVPFIEAGVTAGYKILPQYETEEFGLLSGATCFDLDFPDYIINAGWDKAVIFLQPSWTWGDVGFRHFNNDAMRAVENGFTLLRCDSAGLSGIVGPDGYIIESIFTGNNSGAPTLFTMPIQPRRQTAYNSFGFVFEWMCVAFTICVLALLILPEALCRPILENVHFL